ncbi:hypothetical protein I203_101588 [Kwoniella mangroviensis CBS 8507]|uniref:uncharacterized protein n=1 Tax=Kwoniella mangroviensis CBS 8507 TaxID=1296122 RepID=UPI00305C0CA2
MTKHQPFKEVEASRPDFDVSYKPHYTKTAEPDFRPGQGLNGLPYSKEFKASKDGFRSVIPENEEKSDIYMMMISGVTPRPVAFVSTLSEDGITNLAPISYFNVCAHSPPIVMISVAKGNHPDGWKDTNHNILTTKEFCISIISESFLEASNYTAVDCSPEVDEWALSGLTQRSSETIKPPHVGESAFSMECNLQHSYEVKDDQGNSTSLIILGRVRRFHIRESVLDPSDPFKILTEKLRPIGRLGGISYSRTNQMVEIPRPVWDQVKDTPEVKEALKKGVKKL